MKKFTYILFLFLSLRSYAQNLVPNSSFENTIHCPIGIGNFSVTYWSSPTWGTPDYYNLCGTNGVSVPQNDFGYQNARTGKAYVGIDIEPNNVREYIQCTLISPLEAGTTYYVKFYVSRGDSTGLACDNIGAYLSTSAIYEATNYSLAYIPQVASSPNSPITNAIDWIEISGTYVAIGGEEYLTIGVFTDDNNTDWDTVSGGWASNEAYYYIDDVCVSKDSGCIYSTECDFILPSAFSPNYDNINDDYKWVQNCNDIEEFTMRIYNRWGELVFSSDDFNKGWDGNYKGEPQPIDVYAVYVLVVTNGKNISKSASITLLR